MAYTPPSGDAVALRIGGAYAAPAGDAIILDLDPAPPRIVSLLDQVYNLPREVLRTFVDQVYQGVPYGSAITDQVYWLTSPVLSVCDVMYSLRLAAVTTQYYSDTPRVLAALDQYYGNAYLCRRAVEQRYNDANQALGTVEQRYGDASRARRAVEQQYGDATLVRGAVVQEYAHPAPLCAVMAQEYSVAGEQTWGVVEQLWSIQAVDTVRRELAQVFGLLGDPGVVLPIATADVALYEPDFAGGFVGSGSELDPVSIAIEASLEQYALSCKLGIATQAEYLACRPGSQLTLLVGETLFVFRVEGRSRNREHGEAAYAVTALSPAAWLDAPYAETVSGEYSGLASTIAATLAGAIPLTWSTVDWYIPAATLLAGEETPLALIRKLAAAVGAVVQSLPDGSLTVIPAYPVRVPDWPAAVAVPLSDNDVYTASEDYEYRPGYNRYVISDLLDSSTAVRLDEATVDAQCREIRGYRTPWAPIPLRHTGGDWVTLTAQGVEEREIEEVVEFVAGEGRTQYPIYARISMAWLQTSLGSITHSEEGLLRADVDGESLLNFKYRTRCNLWEVRSPKIEQVQMVADEVE